MVKSERGGKKGLMKLNLTCLHFALDGGQSQDRFSAISTIHVQARFCDLSNKDPW